MSVTDSDLEQLETLLDGEMPEQEAAMLRRRIIFEPALATAMETLRSERAMRVKVWQSMEPDAAAMSRVAERVDRKMHNHLSFAKTLSNVRRFSAAAACIVVGVMVGRFGGWDRSPAGPQTPANSNTTIAKIEPTKAAQPVKLAIVNDYGEVVDYVTLPSAEAASQFTNDLRLENERKSGTNGNTVLTGAPAQGKF